MTNQNNTTTLELPSEREIVITRVFDAPAKLVFEAWTNPEHVPHWWGPSSETMVVCDIDLRVGGGWRYVTHSEESGDVGFNGEFREIAPYNRLVYTENFEGMPGEPSIVTLTFEEKDGKTFYKSVSVYPSAEIRDIVISTGMESGMRETMDRLANRIATLLQTTA